MAQYLVVTEAELGAFEREVNDLLDQDYDLAGNFVVIERVTAKERHPRGASDDPRHPAAQACGAT